MTARPPAKTGRKRLVAGAVGVVLVIGGICLLVVDWDATDHTSGLLRRIESEQRVRLTLSRSSYNYLFGVRLDDIDGRDLATSDSVRVKIDHLRFRSLLLPLLFQRKVAAKQGDVEGGQFDVTMNARGVAAESPSLPWTPAAPWFYQPPLTLGATQLRLQGSSFRVKDPDTRATVIALDQTQARLGNILINPYAPSVPQGIFAGGYLDSGDLTYSGITLTHLSGEIEIANGHIDLKEVVFDCGRDSVRRVLGFDINLNTVPVKVTIQRKAESAVLDASSPRTLADVDYLLVLRDRCSAAAAIR